MSTVYVFGAGASRHVGYPLAAEMGRGMIEFMLKSDHPFVRASGELLVDTFGISPNIEDLITELQQRIKSLKEAEAPEDRSLRLRLGNSRGWLGVSLREWFREIHLMPAPDYAMFAERIESGDTILTFNYDDSLERELKCAGKWDISRGYGFPLGHESHSSVALVLKLHGSIKWLVSVFGGVTGGALIVDPSSSLGDHPVVHRQDLEFLGYPDFAGSTYESGGAFPCLILPDREKLFYYDTSLGQEYASFWDHLWSQAATSLRNCNKIVLCGYSLLPVDRRACDLLLKRPEKDTRIEVVSGGQSERISNDFLCAGFTNVSVFEGGDFGAWCRANR